MTPKWGFDQLPKRSAPSHTPEPSSQPNLPHRNIGLRPQGATIRQQELTYGTLHLLGLTSDVRNIFWAFIASLVNNQPCALSTKPTNEYFSLLLTCRQVYHELETSWRRFCVPWNRVDKMLSQVPNEVTIHQFHQLTLEIPQEASPLTMKHLCGFLFMSKHVLKELRIYFYGVDRYGTKIFIHGCANLEDEKTERKLPIDGQNFEKFNRLWQTILFLRQLEVLVISNANLQVYQYMILAEKPGLKYLQLISDPRSTLHQQHPKQQLGPLLIEPTKDTYPPVEVLHISANAAFMSVQFATKLMESLRHLTWTVPDSSMSSGGMQTSCYTHTAELFNALRLRAHSLEVLRVCISGTGIYETYGGYDELIGAIRLNLKHVPSLRRFEFHCKSKSYWFGKELIQSIPVGLTNLYLSDRIIHPYDLLCVIHEEVLKAIAPIPGVQRGRHDGAVVTKVSCQPIDDDKARLESLSHLLPMNQEPWLIKLDPFSYDTCNSGMDKVFERQVSDTSLVLRQAECQRDNSFLSYKGNDMVGENLNRRDYIPFHTKRLIFIHFEYDHSENGVHANCPSTTFQVMLFINGRLLDRFRNNHLISHDCGKTIGPANKTGDLRDYDKETATGSANLRYAVMLYNLYEIEYSRPKLLQEALAELNDSDLSDDNSYFGKEDEAYSVFEDESVARVENLQKLTYVVEKEVCVDGNCHWSCPDAKVYR